MKRPVKDVTRLPMHNTSGQVDSAKTWTRLHPGRLWRHALVQNALALYGVQIAGYIVPLVTIPYLARVLGAAGWGLVAFTQSFGTFVALVGEYGFGLSATREVARCREDRTTLSNTVAGVLGAKGVLAVASLAVALVVRLWIPIFDREPMLFWAGVFWGLCQCFSMIWFFQGLERMRLMATLDVASKALGTLGVFVFVHSPRDGWRVLVVQGLAFLVCFIMSLWFIYRAVPFQLPNRSAAWEALRMGWSMFLFRGSVSLYTSANAFILGFFVKPQSVGYYAAAEKISRACLGLLTPISQALYPRLSYLIGHSRVEAVRLARIGFLLVGGSGTVMGGFVLLAAPLLVHIIMGREFAPAIPLLRIFALLPPLIALGYAYGIQWMIPLGLDRPFNTVILLAGLLNAGLAVVLAPRYADMGMAGAVVTAEAFVTLGMYLVLRRRKLDPMSYTVKDVEEGTALPIKMDVVA